MAAVRYEVDRRDAPAGGSSIVPSWATCGRKTHATSNDAEDTDNKIFAQ
jgi:hypothetical protein